MNLDNLGGHSVVTRSGWECTVHKNLVPAATCGWCGKTIQIGALCASRVAVGRFCSNCCLKKASDAKVVDHE